VATYKYLLIGALCVFAVIGTVGVMRQRPKRSALSAAALTPNPVVEEIALAAAPPPKAAIPPLPKKVASIPLPEAGDLPQVDRIEQLFALDSSRLPIVETVRYTSRVPWLEGRSAWISDYASHYETSRHFIARSLNRKPDYLTQKVAPGDRFNVFRKDKKIEFYLLIDISRCRMWFYCYDASANERILLKTYRVGLGRMDAHKASGSLTPVGKYTLGEKIAIYKPGIMGFFQDQKTEMLRVFGTRWIPFEKEIERCSEPAKGLGIHGAPWIPDPTGSALVEDRSRIGTYDSDGCIRLAQEDIEELYAILITKPTTVELTKDFHTAKLPGIERSAP